MAKVIQTQKPKPKRPATDIDRRTPSGKESKN